MNITRIHRFNTYQVNEEITRERSLDTDNGTFQLEIKDDQSGSFKVITPTGDYIDDNFNDFVDRKLLYDNFEPGLYKWLREVQQCIETETIKEKKDKEFAISMNSEKYVMAIDRKTGMCTLKYPEHTREFYISKMYEECPDLPILYEGRLNEYLRDKLRRLGVDVPKTPDHLDHKHDEH